MALIQNVLDEFSCDITITRARYNELLKAEHDANCLKDLIFQKAKNFETLDYKEIKLLKELYFIPENESEEKENGSN